MDQVTTRSDLASAPAGAGAAAGPDSAPTAIRRALDPVGPGAKAVFLFASPDLGADRVAAQAQAAAGEVPVIGMTSDACFGAPGVVRGGCSALALGAPYDVSWAIAREAGRDPRDAGRRAAAEAMAALDPELPHSVLLLMLYQPSGDQAEAIAGAYAVTGGAVPFAGGAAAGNPPALIAEGEAPVDAVIAVAIGSPEPIGVGMAHGCRPKGVPAIVTDSEGMIVRQLDGRPAQEVYLEKHGMTGTDMDDEQFGDFAAVHPLAQPELSGDVRLRHVISREPGGGLRSVTHIPVNAAVHFTEQTPEDIVSSTHDAVAAARAGLGGQPVRAALVFDCAGRKHVLGAALDSEAGEILAAFGSPAPPAAGLYTRGEVGRVRGAKGDRNHALVVVALA